jgi:hypothetical protein
LARLVVAQAAAAAVCSRSKRYRARIPASRFNAPKQLRSLCRIENVLGRSDHRFTAIVQTIDARMCELSVGSSPKDKRGAVRAGAALKVPIRKDSRNAALRASARLSFT